MLFLNRFQVVMIASDVENDIFIGSCVNIVKTKTIAHGLIPHV